MRYTCFVRLTVQSDYALRCLMYLAMNPDRVCTIAEIAVHFEISRHHLVKVVHKLSRCGFIRSTRGRGGGIELASAPSELALGRVVRATETDLGIVECFQRDSACLIEPACRLKAVLGEALEAFFDVLDQHTLQDLTFRNRKLRTLLLQEAH